MILFRNTSDGLTGPRSQLVEIPSVGNKEELFEALAVALRFPDYFGRNWDAFEECLSDLSWLSTPQVVIFHKTTPLQANPSELAMYLSILRVAIERLAEYHCELTVVFPTKDEDRIQVLVSKPNSGCG